jgi:hypothetical protein
MFFTGVVKDGGADSDKFGNTMSQMFLSQSYKSPTWSWRRAEKIKWTDRVRNEEILQRVKEERNILHTITRRKSNRIGDILRRNCPLKHVIEGKIEEGIEVTES